MVGVSELLLGENVLDADVLLVYEHGDDAADVALQPLVLHLSVATSRGTSETGKSGILITRAGNKASRSLKLHNHILGGMLVRLALCLKAAHQL